MATEQKLGRVKIIFLAAKTFEMNVVNSYVEIVLFPKGNGAINYLEFLFSFTHPYHEGKPLPFFNFFRSKKLIFLPTMNKKKIFPKSNITKEISHIGREEI